MATTPITNEPTQGAQGGAIQNDQQQGSELNKRTKDEARIRGEKLEEIQQESEEKNAAALARQYNLPYIDLNIVPIDVDILAILPEMRAKTSGTAVIHKDGKSIQVAITDPLSEKAKEALEWLKKEGYTTTAVVVSPTSLSKAHKRYEFVTAPVTETKAEVTKEELEKVERNIQHLDDLKTKIKTVPISEALNTILGGAIKMKASDIHLEPEENAVRIRYRIDGVLEEIADIDASYYRHVVSRIKNLSNLKLNITKEAQDGRFSVYLASGEVDIRVSIIPGNYGESVVMRLLNQANVALKLDALGFEGRAREIIDAELRKPTGMILTTGPTGSGKTTTLYSFISKVNNEETKVVTLEDPVEYKLEGVQQTQIDADAGYTFANGLRAILRQDPDVIMVGEIRDLETAEIAVHAALTGHVVFSTLHTNDAAGAIPRLMDMGVQPAFIKPSINAVIGQRLVRRLCDACKEEYEPAKETLDNITKVLAVISPKAKVEIPQGITKMYRATGCEECNNSGYKGRIGIYEVFTITAEIEQHIMSHSTSAEILAAAIEGGMVTMLQDGILKAVRGVTSMDEVYRVIGEGVALTDIYENILSGELSSGIELTEDEFTTTASAITNIQALGPILENADSKQLTNLLIAAAIQMNAGDIHIEPDAEGVKIRFRIDGILQEVGTLDNSKYPNLIGHVKILGGFKGDADEPVLDGRFSINDRGENVDARISIIKGGYGETIVLRILKANTIALSTEQLGFRQEVVPVIENQLQKPNGMLLVTGPTGSGKTTTLYAFLNKLNTPENKVITIEDPIEYRLEGILQTQTNEEKDYTFATALRALLRQNPNVIMVGEIRDQETGEIATQAALTGHLLLSTLHTNNAAAAFQRLSNMGVNTSDVAAATNAVIGQRLIRKLCNECKKEYTPDETIKQRILETVKNINNVTSVDLTQGFTLYTAQQCEACNGLGYKGIIGIYEVLEVTKEIEEKVNFQASAREIEELAKEQGMITMAQDGILKAIEGITTIEEVLRVTK